MVGKPTVNIGPCVVKGCDKASKATGLCAAHYAMKRRNGDPEKRQIAPQGSGHLDLTNGYGGSPARHPLAGNAGGVRAPGSSTRPRRAPTCPLAARRPRSGHRPKRPLSLAVATSTRDAPTPASNLVPSCDLQRQEDETVSQAPENLRPHQTTCAAPPVPADEDDVVDAELVDQAPGTAVEAHNGDGQALVSDDSWGDVDEMDLAPDDQVAIPLYQLNRKVGGGFVNEDTGEVEQTIDAVLLAKANTRAYWKDPFGKGDAAPTCRSEDNIVPSDRSIEKQSPTCASCRHSKWEGETRRRARGDRVLAFAPPTTAPGASPPPVLGMGSGRPAATGRRSDAAPKRPPVASSPASTRGGYTPNGRSRPEVRRSQLTGPTPPPSSKPAPTGSPNGGSRSPPTTGHPTPTPSKAANRSPTSTPPSTSPPPTLGSRSDGARLGWHRRRRRPRPPRRPPGHPGGDPATADRHPTGAARRRRLRPPRRRHRHRRQLRPHPRR